MIVDNRTLWSSLKTQNVTVSVKRTQRPEFVFEVSRLVNMGAGRNFNKRMVFLTPCDWQDMIPAMTPGRMPSLFDKAFQIQAPQDFVLTRKTAKPVPSAKEFLQYLFGKQNVGEISSDVLRPGDFVVFKPEQGKMDARLAGMLRLVAH